MVIVTLGSTGNVLSQALFKILQESEDPFCCPHCRLVTQDKQLKELKTMVEDYSKEVVLLKTTVSEINQFNPLLLSNNFNSYDVT